MNQEIKDVNKQYLFNYFLYLFIVLFLVGTIILTNIFISEAYAFIFYLIELFSIIAFSGFFRRRIDEITTKAYLIKIRSNEAEPMDLNKMFSTGEAHQILLNKGYKVFNTDKYHETYFRTTKDQIKKMNARYMLEIVVVIHRTNEFYLDAVDEEINRIRDNETSNKRRTTSIFVTQIMDLDHLDDEVKEKIKEVIFVRANRMVISTINVGLFKKYNKAIMLYSKAYSPSLYYNYHIEQIEDLL